MMSTVTSLPQSRPLTRDDLERMPDDGHRYELVEGTLVVTPAPGLPHQTVAFELAKLLDRHCPPHVRVVMAPFDVVLTSNTVVQPDVLVAERSALTQRDLPGPPLLAVEVITPSTRMIDLHVKRAVYEEAGCPSYWVVDPLAPSLTAWQLVDGRYVEAAHATGDDLFSVTSPLTLELRPVDLQG
jgi:Uma2 family endonuclease